MIFEGISGNFDDFEEPRPDPGGQSTLANKISDLFAVNTTTAQDPFSDQDEFDGAVRKWSEDCQASPNQGLSLASPPTAAASNVSAGRFVKPKALALKHIKTADTGKITPPKDTSSSSTEEEGHDSGNDSTSQSPSSATDEYSSPSAKDQPKKTGHQETGHQDHVDHVASIPMLSPDESAKMHAQYQARTNEEQERRDAYRDVPMVLNDYEGPGSVSSDDPRIDPTCWLNLEREEDDEDAVCEQVQSTSTRGIALDPSELTTTDREQGQFISDQASALHLPQATASEYANTVATTQNSFADTSDQSMISADQSEQDSNEIDTSRIFQLRNYGNTQDNWYDQNSPTKTSQHQPLQLDGFSGSLFRNPNIIFEHGTQNQYAHNNVYPTNRPSNVAMHQAIAEQSRRQPTRRQPSHTNVHSRILTSNHPMPDLSIGANQNQVPIDFRTREEDSQHRVPLELQICNPERNQLIFGSREAAAAARTSRKKQNCFTDTTMPQTAAEERIWVKIVIDAMKYMGKAEDNEKMKASWKKIADDDPQMVELAAWEIFSQAYEYHTLEGLLRPNASYAHKCPKRGTFKETMAEVIDGLKVQKTFCKRFAGDDGLASFIDNTSGNVKRVIGNRDVNKKKKEHTEEGRRAREWIENHHKKGDFPILTEVPQQPPKVVKKRKGEPMTPGTVARKARTSRDTSVMSPVSDSTSLRGRTPIHVYDNTAVPTYPGNFSPLQDAPITMPQDNLLQYEPMVSPYNLTTSQPVVDPSLPTSSTEMQSESFFSGAQDDDTFFAETGVTSQDFDALCAATREMAAHPPEWHQ